MQAMQSSHILFLVFTIAVVVSVVVQATVFGAILVIVFKNLGKLLRLFEELSARALPIVADVRDLVQDVSPKVRTISSQVVEITSAVRDQTLHVNTTVDEVVDKTRVQANKVDDMVSAVLGTIAHAGSTVQSGVTRPARKVGGVLHGIRVGLETLFKEETKAPPNVPGEPAAYAATSHTATPNQAAGSYRTEVRTTVLEDGEELPNTDQAIQPPPTTSSPR